MYIRYKVFGRIKNMFFYNVRGGKLAGVSSDIIFITAHPTCSWAAVTTIEELPMHTNLLGADSGGEEGHQAIRLHGYPRIPYKKITYNTR